LLLELEAIGQGPLAASSQELEHQWTHSLSCFKLALIHELLYAVWDPAIGVIRKAASLSEARFSKSKSIWVIPWGV